MYCPLSLHRVTILSRGVPNCLIDRDSVSITWIESTLSRETWTQERARAESTYTYLWFSHKPHFQPPNASFPFILPFFKAYSKETEPLARQHLPQKT